MKKTKHNCDITDDDYKIFRCLWKWKAVSTMAIAKKFIPEIRPASVYRRLLYLEADGYIESVIVEGRRHEVWTLAKRGFRYILPKLGELESVGYKSENYYHDYLTTAFHLGEWLTHQPNETETYSEQQLRRYPMDAWPSWIPRSTMHRPDGYSAYTLGERTTAIAFEVELSIKAKHRYESVVAYYDAQESIQYVFWLVNSEATLKALKHAFEKYQARHASKHYFILLKDFFEHGWMARFQHETLGKSPATVLPILVVTPSSPWHHCSDTFALLNTRKKPINTVIYQDLVISKKANRVSG